MSATKLNLARALLLKAEASYNAGGTVAAATDGFLLAEPVQPTLSYLHSGERRPSAPPAMGGYMRRVPPTGAELAFNITHESKGAAAAYSASVFPSVHRALLGAGFDAAVTTTGGSEKWDYTPTSLIGTPTSLLGELYARKEKYPFTGAYLNLESIAFELGMPPLWTFAVRSLIGTIADAAIPAVTYPTLTTEPPRAVSIALALGSWSTNAVVRSGLFNMGRTIGQRANLNVASGHAGFSPGRRTPTLELLVEQTALQGSPFHNAAGIDPYQLFAAATELTASLQIGTVQYNRWSIIPGQLQMADVPALEEDDGAALWRLRFQCNPTALNNNDDVTFRFN